MLDITELNRFLCWFHGSVDGRQALHLAKEAVDKRLGATSAKTETAGKATSRVDFRVVFALLSGSSRPPIGLIRRRKTSRQILGKKKKIFTCCYASSSAQTQDDNETFSQLFSFKGGCPNLRGSHREYEVDNILKI